MVKYLRVSDTVYEALTVEMGDRGARTVTEQGPRANSLQEVHGQGIFDAGTMTAVKDSVRGGEPNSQSDTGDE